MDVRRRCDECNRPLHSNQVAKCGGCCTKELKKMRRDLGYDNKQLVSEMTSQSRSQIKELEAQSRKQIEELDAKSTLKIQQLEAQSRVQIEDLQARLDFLRLRFDNDQADGIGKKDVLIVVTGDGEDEFLYCHKVVLVSVSVPVVDDICLDYQHILPIIAVFFKYGRIFQYRTTMAEVSAAVRDIASIPDHILALLN